MISIKKQFGAILAYLVIIGILWITFAPVQIGGLTSYVIINGNSMEPDVHLGDLVVTRKSDQYEIDQRVVYQHPNLGHVFHRIVDMDGERFILQGDNNDWLDSHQPAADEILGRFWFKIPRGGFIIKQLRNPLYFSGFVILIFLIAASLSFTQNEEKPKRNNKRRSFMDNNSPSSITEIRQELLLLFGILGAIAIILGFLSFSKPLTMEVSSGIDYTHQGIFNYTSDEKALVYNSATIKTGDPVYSQLMCEVKMDFDYSLSPQESSDQNLEDFKGSYLIDLVLSDVDGWNRSYQLVPETEYTGSGFSAQLDVNICDMQTLIEDKENKTGVESKVYDLSILPSVSIAGSLNGIPFKDTYAPRILFQIDSNLMRLPDKEEGLNLDEEGSISLKRIVPNIIPILGRFFSVEKVRTAAGILFGFAVLGSVYPAWSLLQDWKESKASRIKVAQKPLLVDIEIGSLKSKGIQVIPVEAFQDLVKMAERYGAMILHEAGEDFHRYSVQDGQTLFQYTLDSPPASEKEDKS
jgi:signal peptidase I